MVFTHWKLLPRTSVQARNNADKLRPGAPKTVPGPFRNPPKSTPEAPKSTPERCKTRKNQPRATTNAAGDARSAQERKMVPTWSKLSTDLCSFGPADPPPYIQHSIYSSSYHQVDLTRPGTCKQVRRILEGVGEGFGTPKSMFFAYFSMIFRCQNRSAF